MKSVLIMADRFVFATPKNIETFMALLKAELLALPPSVNIIYVVSSPGGRRIISEAIRNLGIQCEISLPGFGEQGQRGRGMSGFASEVSDIYDYGILFDTPYGYHRSYISYMAHFGAMKNKKIRRYLIYESAYSCWAPEFTSIHQIR